MSNPITAHERQWDFFLGLWETRNPRTHRAGSVTRLATWVQAETSVTTCTRIQWAHLSSWPSWQPWNMLPLAWPLWAGFLVVYSQSKPRCENPVIKSSVKTSALIAHVPQRISSSSSLLLSTQNQKSVLSSSTAWAFLQLSDKILPCWDIQ